MGFLNACDQASEVVWRKIGAEARRAAFELPAKLWYVGGMADIQTQNVRVAKLVGTWRHFGTFGPAYEIVEAGTEIAAGDRTMRIRVVGTGEELDYRLAEILEDPVER
jgi:hypothetical protein